jgi:hypothetical protein
MILRFSDHILTAGQAAPVLPAGAAFANLGNWIYNASFQQIVDYSAWFSIIISD